MKQVGRNDPCPCGSGKKFKKCCESKGSVKAHLKATPIVASPKMSSIFHRHITPTSNTETPPENEQLNM
jgi:hypothetical protein